MTKKWNDFVVLFSVMLEKYGNNFPSEDDMHTLLESIKQAKNDDIDNSGVSQQEKDFAKLSNEVLQQTLEQIYHQYRMNDHGENSISE